MYRLHRLVYGSIAINEPVIIELLDSRLLQRLKHIAQSGAAVYVNPKRDGISLDSSKTRRICGVTYNVLYNPSTWLILYH